MKNSGSVMTLIQQRLAAASEVLSMMSVFKLEVVPCVPPHYAIMDMFIDVFEEHFVPLASELCSVEKASALEPAEVLQLVDWFEFYQIQMDTYGVELSASKHASVQVSR